MSRFSSRYLPGFTLQALALAGAALLLCLLVLSGCTQPVIPSPTPAQTTPLPAATTQAPVPPPVTAVTTAAKGSGYTSYANSRQGFTISYPSGWSMQEGAGESVVSFTSPSRGMGDIPASMKIYTDDLSRNPMSLEQFKNAQLAKKQALDKYNIIYDLAYKGSGFNGWKIGYTYDAGTLMKSFEIYAIRGTTAFTLSYTSEEDQFAGHSVDMDTMFRSFQLQA